jgi:uncharacterized protein YbcV (DUF1398 family)
VTPAQKEIAYACLKGAENNTMIFPEIVQKLMQAGFESYSIDFRRARAIYYLHDGQSVEHPTQESGSVAENFDVAAVREAIREAQKLFPGYSYNGFCKKVMKAGCAGYFVSFTGRRAVYVGRTADTHVEYFPS